MNVSESPSPTLSKRGDSVDDDTQNISCCCKRKRVLSQSTGRKESKGKEPCENE